MPGYEVLLNKQSEGFISRLDRGDQGKLLKQLEKLERSPELGPPLGAKLGKSLAGFRKLPVLGGRLRIIYEVDEQERQVHVLAIGPREDARVYKIADAEAKQKRLRRIG